MKKLSFVLFLVMATPAWAYTVTINEPSEDRAYRRPAQTADIGVSVIPQPTDLHTLVIKVNGNYHSANTYNVSLPSIDYNPGEQIITAELRDETGRVVSSDTRKIYFIQKSVIIDEQRKKAKQKIAYNNLPWYKRLYVSLRQDEIELDTTGITNADLPPIEPANPIDVTR